MRVSVESFSPELSAFLAERHLGTLVTLRPDGSPHAVPVGFTVGTVVGAGAGGGGGGVVVRVITSGASVKAANARGAGRAGITQVDGRRWTTLEGSAKVLHDEAAVASAVAAYAARYREPKGRADRVVIEIQVDRVMCNSGLR